MPLIQDGSSRFATPGVEETTQRGVAYASFTEQILSGAVRAGQFLTQRELTGLLGVPLGAVRELIPRLEAGGLVHTVPQRGLQITPVDLKFIRNAFHVRAMVEREAVQRYAVSASDASLRQIEARHQDLLQRARLGESPAQLQREAQAVDWGLHDAMVDALGNDIIAEIYRVNSLRIRLISQENPMQLVPAMEEHLRFIAALRRRDAAAAAELLDAHIDNARHRVLEAALGQFAQVSGKVRSTMETGPLKPARGRQAQAPRPARAT